jgi:phytoene desaturase
MPIETANKPLHAAVLGAGFGGIAAALRLRALGFDVTLIERHADLGGRARHRVVDGYHFDLGPTVITAPELIDELFALFGKRRVDYLALMPVEPWYRLIDANQAAFNYGGTLEQQLAEIAKFSPSDVDGYLALLKHAEKLYQKGYVELGAAPFQKLSDMLRVAPHLIRLRADRSVATLVSKHIKHPSLRQFFCMHSLLVGGDPRSTSSIYTLIHALERKGGVWFAKGGTAAVVAALAQLMQEQGVKIQSGHNVRSLVIEQYRGKPKVTGVETDQGTQHFDVVVSNLDPATLYRHVIPKYIAHRHQEKALLKKRYSFGLYVFCFGTKKQYPDVAHHTVLFGPRFDALLQDINGGILPDDPSLYLHRPTASDASLAPPGHDSFYVLAPVPHNGFGIDWKTKAAGFLQRIIEQLQERLLPDLVNQLTIQFELTPDYFEQELGSTFGAGFSIAPTLTQSAYFRFHNRCDDIAGLYLCGAGTHPGAGVPGVLNSAKVVEALVRSDYRFRQNRVAPMELTHAS